jgi:hypothetical protein
MRFSSPSAETAKCYRKKGMEGKKDGRRGKVHQTVDYAKANTVQ